ncbi:putative cytochrome P450 [Eremomyces bilateralis CBS 781.70]|uniref:Cytochrome P450 n=1 Tax=Eremomyces bilateralis CBS 781.70 TaxID=1392243 RepID=A0A6G1FQ37_9PEZI|nr:putative cytochrome P450 [Eremomyces bilateralis CBS 781.70]KAF1807907.1 putative cytochrome P450 [Eremomyces bilateralis CBS 781.70]
MPTLEIDWNDRTSITGAVLVIYAIYWVFNAVYLLYFHPLAKFPGPKLPVITAWYTFYHDVVRPGMMMWEIEKWHRKYGPIIRINADEIHIKDSHFYETLYAPKGRKADRWARLSTMFGTPESVFAASDSKTHKERRTPLNPFFSRSTVSKLEPVLQEKVSKLTTRLTGFVGEGDTALVKARAEERRILGREEGWIGGKEIRTREPKPDPGGVVRLDVAFFALTQDVVCDYSFAKDWKHLDHAHFNPESKDSQTEGLEAVGIIRLFPMLPMYLQELPRWAAALVSPAFAMYLDSKLAIRKEIIKIMEGKVKKESKSDRTVFDALINSDLLPEHKTLNRLTAEGSVLIIAGTDTTARALSFIFFYLLKDKEMYAKLKAALMEVMPDPNNVPPWIELEKIPYLYGCMREGLRLSHGLTSRQSRVSNQPVKYKGWEIPPNTPVSESAYFVLSDPEIFPEPEKFVPERWMGTAAQRSNLERYMVSWGKGNQQCLGMHLATAEIVLATAVIVRRFEMELYRTTLEDVQVHHDSFVAAVVPWSRGIRVILTESV